MKRLFLLLLSLGMMTSAITYNQNDYERALNGDKNLENANLEGATFMMQELLEKINPEDIDDTRKLIKDKNFDPDDFHSEYSDPEDLDAEDFFHNLHKKKHMNLKNANLKNANLKNTFFLGVDLKNANLEGASLKNTFFFGVDIANANLEGAIIEEAILLYANFYGANLKNANLKSTNLIAANLTNTNLTNANLAEADLRRAILMWANLENTNFYKANLEKANLYKANLKVANTYKANIRNINYEATVNWVTPCFYNTNPESEKDLGNSCSIS